MSIVNRVDRTNQKLMELSLHIVKEYKNGKMPLFVIGSGISTDLRNSVGGKGEGKKGIPSMDRMLEKLYSLYALNDKEKIPPKDIEDIEKRFKIWSLERGKKVDRGNVAGILGYFQERGYLRDLWVRFNDWLLNECVDEDAKVGILKALPSEAHKKIAELYEKVNAFCLTTNFDGLLFTALRLQYSNKAHSFYTKEQVGKYFIIEQVRDKHYAEIQIRGDIFFVECNPEWCDQYSFCEDCSSTPARIWETSPLTCRRGRHMKPYISFPGTYEKDRRVREIIGLLWQYLAYRVSSVITIGIGGLWDPIVVAFLSDLANERDLPFVDINISTESSYLRKEIIIPDTSGKRFLLNKPANEFMDVLSQLIDQNIDDIQKRPMIEVVYARDNLGEDKFWDKILKKWELSDFEKRLIMNPLVEISSRFAQLGLKSKWWGVSNEYRWHHNRLNHSKGVMKIASLLYEKACENSNRQKNELEKQFLRIAALLHDIGHLPFSHLIEEVFQELNWKPGGYAESFSHDYYTAEKVRKIFQDETLNTELNKIGYSIEDLIKLINGEYGIGFLDAIINGPIDADKIDYIFRDVELTNVITHLVEPKKVLDDIGRQISISPTGLLVLKGDSALASFTILDQRERLYKNLYLSKPIRLMEKALKFIIITYFVHTFNTIEINTLEISENIRNKFLENEKQLSDLGGIRIAMASEELESLSEKFKAEDDIEMKIVNHMKSVLDKKPINISVKRAINECFSLIEGVNGEKVCKDEAEKRFKKLSNNKFSREREEKFRYDAKTTILRYPGAVLIDVLPPFEYFKIAGGRKPKARSDGTNKESECILWDDSIEIRKRIQEKIKHEQGEINVYRIGENSEVDRAIGLIEKLLGEERKLEEVE